MDQSTHNVRIARWKSIIQSCQERPAGITAKQWLAENNISDKSYYYYLRKFRKEAYLSLDQESSLTPLVSNQNQVSFAEVPFDMPEQQKNEILDTLVNHPVAVIKTGASNIAISRYIPAELLKISLQELSNA